MCVRKNPRLLGLLVLSQLTFVQWATAADYLVTSTADSGAGTLRQALLNANENPGLDRIRFQIAGTGIKTLAPATPLPPITDPLILDGTTQPGYVDRPLIEINGFNAGANSGLRLLAGDSEVRGLCINRFGAEGIRIEGPGTNLLRANFVGTDPTGIVARGNGTEGILVFGSFGNIIGGTNAADRNLVSGNGNSGVYLLNGGGNLVLGNRIGSSVSGLAALRNGNNGVTIYNSSGNTLGGEAASARNLVSGNTGSGVYLFGPSAFSNFIGGNYIGVNVSASTALSNSADGVTLFNSPSNVIGGAFPEGRNIISANGGAGVFLNGAGARANIVQNNLIGPDATGSISLGNRMAGIALLGALSNRIGGSVQSARNLISGNKQDGIFCATNTVGNLIQGNWIGTDIAGMKALSNSMNGIALVGARSNYIGGLAAPLGNVISGNGLHGVSFSNLSSGNVIHGNLIGTAAGGLSAVANHQGGVRVDSHGNRVGGVEAGARNVISGNRLDGVWLVGRSASNNVVQGNLIGLSAVGTNKVANGRAGVGITDAPGSLIGGAQAGAGNVISGNVEAGIYLYLAGAAFSRVEGNKIGTDPSGTKALGNGWEGIYMNTARSNWIGGAAPGAGNLIAGNNTYGVWLTNSPGNTIQGNWIGISGDGNANFGSVFHALELSAGSSNNVVGAQGLGSNRIANAKGAYTGIRIRDGATRNSILGNEVHGNGGLGIDLGAPGVLPNDPCDADAGSNLGQNYPEISQAMVGGIAPLHVRGTLRSVPAKTYLLQFFASPNCDAAGNGEGQTFLGYHLLTLGASCSAEFTASLEVPLPPGFVVTATATDPDGNSSEFSKCVTAVQSPKLEYAYERQADTLTLAWTNAPGGLVLKQTLDLTPPVHWSDVTNSVTLQNGLFRVSLPVGQGNVFYALAPE